MKTIDLRKKELSISEILKLAKSDAVLIHSNSGEEFVLEQADSFDREVADLSCSEKFMKFLDSRSAESGDLSMNEIRKVHEI
jgi:transcription initiation factor TFIID subunit TAF12